MNVCDLVRIKDPHPCAGMTASVERIGVSDVVIRLSATGQAMTVRRDDVRRIIGQPVTVKATLARRRAA